MIKANFKISKPSQLDDIKSDSNTKYTEKQATREEWEEFVSKAGAAGSFMVYRSDKKEDELGLEEL